MLIIIEEFHIDAELLPLLHEASEEDLHALAELHEDPANDGQIELCIYLYFLIFQKSLNRQNLEEAIQRAEGWAAATAASHPDHDRRYTIMDTLILWCHQHRTIEEDVRAKYAPLQSRESATNKLDLPIRLQGESSRLLKSFVQTGRFECLKEGIEKIELAISIAGEYTTTGMLNNLGIMLGIRFMQTGSIDDLDQAINVLSEAVDATPHNHSDRAGYLSNLGVPLLERFGRKGSIEDLNQAISVLSEAVDSMPRGHPDGAGCLTNLGASLAKRFQWMGSIDDLDRAVDVAREAVTIAPQDHPDRVRYSSTFGTVLGERFKRTGSLDDLNQAISILSEAVDVMPHGHPDRATLLNNLGAYLDKRFQQTGSIDDIVQAISNSGKAVNELPLNHPRRVINLSNLGSYFLEQSRRAGTTDACNQAITINREVVRITPLDDPNRAYRVCILASCLIQKHNQTGLPKSELKRLILMLTTSWHCDITPPSQRIQAAKIAAEIMMLQKDWKQSYQLLQEAISLLHTVSPRFSNRTDAQALLTTSFGLASAAVSAALNAKRAPKDALRLLEHGRGVIASLLMDMRGDITDLQRQYPDLAEKFGVLRDELDMPSRSAISTLASTDKVSSWELQRSRHREAIREFSEVIDIIRAQPGFFNFLQPPDAKELMGAAEQGPIIILNIDRFRCDAFLVKPSSIKVIKLRGLDEDEVQDRVTSLLANSDLSPLLEWLWHTICHPCLKALGIKNHVSNDNWPHIWWIPTGFLSQLPLHAAGIYKQGSRETVLDRAVSSYASSIKALLHGRKHRIQKPRQPPSEDSALIVSMQETPGLGEGGRLPFASDEVHMLRDLCPQLQLAPITPSQTKDDVLKHLLKCKIFHFAGHGQSDPRDPSRSCLLLEDWETNPLTVGDIRDSRLQDDPPFLAYLSACSTGANKVTKLADEGIHLISAFQLAGFRHAIGTLWEVSDKHCVDVASILYKTLQEEGMTDLAVSRGLHRAVRALRDGNVDDVLTRDAKLVRPRPASQGVTDFLWVPYVHFGV